MSNNVEAASSNDKKTEEEIPTTSLNDTTPSTPLRLFGHFKQNSAGFSRFSQLSSNGDSSASSTTSYFTSTISKLSSATNTGFGSPSTSLAVSLAPLGSNKPLFSTSSTLKTEKANKEKDGNDDDDDDDDGGEGDDDGDNVSNDNDESNKATPSLFETAAEYEAKRASAHPIAHIQGDTSTGEEHEVTKFQMVGKLYMYNPEQQQYVERGYGILKINESHDPDDWNKLNARLIMRLDKAFRVILNSPIFPQMTVERATERSVRFGAQDESHLRVFIIKASSSDCANLCREIQSRIQIIERQQKAASSHIKSDNNDNADTSDNSSNQDSIDRTRKRSHSNSDSEKPENTTDLSKRSKLIDAYREGNKDSSDEDSVESTKAGEQETNS